MALRVAFCPTQVRWWIEVASGAIPPFFTPCGDSISSYANLDRIPRNYKIAIGKFRLHAASNRWYPGGHQEVSSKSENKAGGIY